MSEPIPTEEAVDLQRLDSCDQKEIAQELLSEKKQPSRSVSTLPRTLGAAMRFA